MFNIDYNSYRSISGFNQRTRFLIFHYTALNFSESVKALTSNAVSAHYLIPDPTDATYIDSGFKDLRIFNLVNENDRAWHTGVSAWSGRSNLNDTSLGIELVNQARDDNGIITFLPYHPQQIAALKLLAINILQRYPDISPTNIIGHSDVSPGRKSDPGALFPWKELHLSGVGAWYDEESKIKYCKQFKKNLPNKNDILEKLKTYGYDTTKAEDNQVYQQLIRSFQLHFRPENYSGNIDVETVAILYSLVDKYKS
ncbi:N-acetylmuramoyl-L-alanine amidase [Vibrio cholerae]|uniref:N-acetylmuramoyl-L-alanine amidase n=2 Tax=Vibrio cholerae TaxID=666 RepID=UPI0010FD7397|nr:N-acetylmuramoyl-L-alanine amidase [Vibrio cholerae]EGR4143501.1 N-acetylmuramoyl-L-alanine amidase [Vibrio cholerae]EJL6325860.1 N-acetylmuramoyl-L-alanine amidase [Vibrio cholerae]EJL6770341.1 N-acetylmuramoyl-L-alanine amidase [Vibrio cholerae]TLE13836.1 N-acetylmuramoyl-L-alanine amidase [Vibrio cholerae]TLE21165.1 N-acetylmuramoyl-L-alanine amidase [Vibrio cholerae]